MRSALLLLLAGPAVADDMPRPIFEIADPARAGGDHARAAWLSEIFLPRCLALRLAEIEDICRDTGDRGCAAPPPEDVAATPVAIRLTEPLPDGFALPPPQRLGPAIAAALPLYRGIYADGAAGTLTDAAGALFSADMRRCRTVSLALPLDP